MNYLHHANKHISSSHHLHAPKRKIGFWRILALLIAILVVYFIFKAPLSHVLFSIRSLVTPPVPTEITLETGALDSKLQAYEVENRELKRLMENAGIRIPRTLIAEDPVESAMEDETQLGVLDVSTASSGTMDALANTANTVSVDVSTSSKKMKIHIGDTLATVLVRPPQSPFDAIVLSVGIKQGIEIGDIVYAFNGFPIGTIVAVENERSTAELFSAPGKKTEVFIGTSTISAIAEGKGGGNFALKLPKVTDIHVGDMVARRLVDIEVFSTIESVDAGEGEAYTHAYFKLPINLNSLTYVLVKKDSYR